MLDREVLQSVIDYLHTCWACAWVKGHVHGPHASIIATDVAESAHRALEINISAGMFIPASSPASAGLSIFCDHPLD